jgi:multidrug resistance efflux pump
MRTWARLLACIAFTFTLAGCHARKGFAEAKQPAAAKPTKPSNQTVPGNSVPATAAGQLAAQPAKGTCKVEKGPFKIEVSLKGVFEAEDMTEVAVHVDSWSPLTVLKAVEHGTPVKVGDPLVTLDLEKIDLSLKDLEAERHQSELALKLAEEELPVLEKSTPLELAQAERSKKQADEDLKRFLEIDRPQAEKSANFMVRSAANYLEYAREELRQLEKMYRANDIREDTEEIILKRQRNTVEAQEFSLKSAEIHRNQTLKVDLPRQEQSAKDNAVKQTLALEKAQSTLPLTLKQKRVALAKAQSDYARTVDKLHKLHKDREAMLVKAPVDGIVYYGKCVRGQWTTASVVAPKLQRAGVLASDEVIMTIVKPRPLFVRATVEEKDLALVHAGVKGKVIPVALPDQKLAATVQQVSSVPLPGGTFDARLAVTLDKDTAALMPGMGCTVNLVPLARADALTVAAGAVFSDDEDQDKHYVYVAGKGGKPQKRTVTIGKTAAGKTEILEGLHAGDEVFLEKPGT